MFNRPFQYVTSIEVHVAEYKNMTIMWMKDALFQRVCENVGHLGPAVMIVTQL